MYEVLMFYLPNQTLSADRCFETHTNVNCKIHCITHSQLTQHYKECGEVFKKVSEHGLWVTWLI